MHSPVQLSSGHAESASALVDGPFRMDHPDLLIP
jgi:hypothetical protein